MNDLENLGAETSEEALIFSLRRLIDAGISVIQIRTRETARVLEHLRKHITTEEGSTYREFDIVHGNRTAFSATNYYNHALAGDSNGDKLPMAIQHPLECLEASKNGNVLLHCVYNVPIQAINGNIKVLELLELYCTLLPGTNCVVILVTGSEDTINVPPGTLHILKAPTPTAEELEKELRAALDKCKEDYEDGIDISDSEFAQLARLGLGMTLDEFRACVYLSIVDTRPKDHTSISLEPIYRGISKGKTEVVKQSDILELQYPESMDNVAGLHGIKDWIAERKDAFTDEAREFGIQPPKAVALVGVPGCLTGDTIVDYKRGARSSSRPITLENLYKKFNGLPTSTRPWVDLTLPTFLHSLGPDGEVFYNRIISVVDAGMKKVICLTFSDGSSLRLTADHPVCTPGGRFERADSLAPGDAVLARGSMMPVKGEGRRLDARPPRRIVNVKHHPHGAYKCVEDEGNTYEYTRLPRARLVIEAHMNGLEYDEFVHILNYNRKVARTLRYLDPLYEVHHVDEDTMNDELSNLMVLHKAEHAREHGKSENFNVEYVREVTVVGVDAVPGLVQTYDVQMDIPANNFVANGIIVHNTGKSLIAKAIASTLQVPLLRLDFGRVFSKFIGDSESRVRSALDMVSSMGQVVLFVDEIDKGLGGIGQGGGDSGVSSRVLGSFLTWMQDNQSGALCVVTANKIDGLPPELFRKGRMDQVFSVGVPNRQERREALAVHLRLRDRDIADMDKRMIEQYLDASERFVPAEVEQTVKDALVLAYHDKGAEDLEGHHLVTAAKRIVPMAVSHAEQINAIEEWAKNNAVPANGVDREVVQEPARSTRTVRRAPRRVGED